MRAKSTQTITQNSIVRVALGTGALLLIPLIGMLVSDEWNWGPGDFIVVGALLFGTGMLYELIAKKITNDSQRAIAIILLVLAFLYVYAELAVGIFTNLGS